MANQREGGGRLTDLDLLRALAVLLVLGRHVLDIPVDLPAAARSFWLAWNQFGWIGVDLFFTLSGFLVSGLLFREYTETATVKPLRFLIRRGLKIYPAFYVFLFCSVGICALAGLYGRPEWARFSDVFPAPNRGRILGELLFLQNYLSYLWGHTWSLAIEEHFYLGLAALVAFSVWRQRGTEQVFRFIPPLVLTIAGCLLLARVILGYVFHQAWWDILPPTHLRIDSLCYGVLLSYAYHLHRAATVDFVRRHGRWMAGATVVLLTPALVLPLENPFMYTGGFTALYLGFGNLILLLRVGEFRGRTFLLQRLRFAAYLGRHSYSIYLWHMPVYLWSLALVRAACGRPVFWLEVLLYFAGTAVVGTGMSLLVEQPVLRLRDRLFPSQSGQTR